MHERTSPSKETKTAKRRPASQFQAILLYRPYLAGNEWAGNPTGIDFIRASKQCLRFQTQWSSFIIQVKEKRKRKTRRLSPRRMDIDMLTRSDKRVTTCQVGHSELLMPTESAIKEL